jgi:hypothetical protein
LSGTARSPERWLGAPSRTKDVLPGKLAREHIKKSLEAFRVRSRHDQIDASRRSSNSLREAQMMSSRIADSKITYCGREELGICSRKHVCRSNAFLSVAALARKRRCAAVS